MVGNFCTTPLEKGGVKPRTGQQANNAKGKRLSKQLNRDVSPRPQSENSASRTLPKLTSKGALETSLTSRLLRRATEGSKDNSLNTASLRYINKGQTSTYSTEYK